MKKKIKRLGIFINPNYDKQEQIFKELKKYLSEDIIYFWLDDINNIDKPDFIEMISETEALDVIFVFGGDGTILRSVLYGINYDVPILGINVGNLGFLSEGNFKDLSKIINSIKLGKFKLQKRILISVSIIRNKEVIYKNIALNDAVVYKGLIPKLIDVNIYNNKQFVLSTRCDGVVVSTPTGSTAYSLSAGGPILSPVMNAMIIAPLNPHILSVRPMIFPSCDSIKLQIANTHNVTILQLDGINVHTLQDGDEVKITESKDKIKFLKIPNKTFYQVLRKKMHMGKL